MLRKCLLPFGNIFHNARLTAPIPLSATQGYGAKNAKLIRTIDFIANKATLKKTGYTANIVESNIAFPENQNSID